MAVDATRYRENVERSGLSKTHRQLISWIAPGSRVLELGCASGYIGRILMEEKGCQVTGVEFDPQAAEEARAAGLTVIQGSLEDPVFRASIVGQFDFVTASDVLEHLRDPAPVLNEFKRWLAPGGQAIISVPNIATWEIRSQLFFRGDFEYKETGIMDRTHVHFFTWDTMHKLVREQDWTILDTTVEKWDVPVAYGIFISAPRDCRKFLERLGSGWGARALNAMFHGLFSALERRGTKIVEGIAKKWPNLCAWNMALLLRPPQNP
ncbi:MAG TPA: methyltransferase domain-containing protein [Polyangiaceae bacterium]|nr:methyltransferase domain-containing protein [Polyangiaceae bacterium]